MIYVCFVTVHTMRVSLCFVTVPTMRVTVCFVTALSMNLPVCVVTVGADHNMSVVFLRPYLLVLYGKKSTCRFLRLVYQRFQCVSGLKNLQVLFEPYSTKHTNMTKVNFVILFWNERMWYNLTW